MWRRRQCHCEEPEGSAGRHRVGGERRRRIGAARSQQFVADQLLIRAAKNIISEIGEAAKGLDDELLATMPGVPWKNVKGMRDKVVHDYPEVDLDVLWETLVHGLPAVGAAIANRIEPGS